MAGQVIALPGGKERKGLEQKQEEQGEATCAHRGGDDGGLTRVVEVKMRTRADLEQVLG